MKRQLIANAKLGHHDAFGELYKRHHLRVYRTALRIPRTQQGAAEAVQRATAARAEHFVSPMLALASFSEHGAYSQEAHQQLEPATGVPQDKSHEPVGADVRTDTKVSAIPS